MSRRGQVRGEVEEGDRKYLSREFLDETYTDLRHVSQPWWCEHCYRQALEPTIKSPTFSLWIAFLH